MLSAADLASMRSTQVTAMPDTCTITRRAVASFNPGTGAYTPGAATSVFSGVCRIRPTVSDRVVQVGEQPVSLQTYDVTLPYNAGDVRVDDLWTGVACTDTRLNGRELRVVDVQSGSWVTARRLIVEDNLG